MREVKIGRNGGKEEGRMKGERKEEKRERKGRCRRETEGSSSGWPWPSFTIQTYNHTLLKGMETQTQFPSFNTSITLYLGAIH